MRCLNLNLCLWLHRLLVITWQIYLLEKWLAKFLRVKICNKIKPTNDCGADRRRTREKMNFRCHSAIFKPNFHVRPCIFAAIFSFCLGFHLTVRFFLKNCFNPAQNPFGILVYQRFVEIMKFSKWNKGRSKNFFFFQIMRCFWQLFQRKWLNAKDAQNFLANI